MSGEAVVVGDGASQGAPFELEHGAGQGLGLDPEEALDLGAVTFELGEQVFVVDFEHFPVRQPTACLLIPSLHLFEVLGEVLGVELEARGLMSELAPGAIWDVSPSLVGRPLQEIEVELGYRFGDLQDPDFAVRSGEGAFLTIGARLTEELIDTAADFWRERMGN